LLQMLLRSANAVGYANYPDNVVRFFVARAAQRGIDVFRIFDSLNWVENMRVAIDAVLEAGKLCEASICYSGNLSDPREKKYTLDYYLELARELKDAGTHVLGIKDMAGLVRPRSAYALVKALKEEVGLPVHFHTHDTSGIAAASVLAAIDAGADAVDGGIDDARWPEVAAAYADVNDLLGDIVKVTPTSKVVGDLALLMVTSGISREQVHDPDTQVAFPESVVEFFRGALGQPHGGFPPAL